ncbi:MAG: tRNA 2-selenouridine(34) synthase MnmH, partial [Rhodobacteraceae bacterium]|nr:tRNA 2-selenouridine(34) synthase MnmH [Paracoccaceae bacterium]
MALTLTQISDLAAAGFDTIIDVRAPAEYAEDHLPGAISLPVLDDAERARVGTIYKQQSPFLARKVGAALVARNAALHLEGPLADKPGGWRPLIYCWRGGQRSGSFSPILAQVGWRVDLLAGGYKSWRALVVAALNDRPFPAPLTVLDGNTGTAKTELLSLLAARGLQTIDLEGLANHRGSLFGHRDGGQPSQKAFEGRLALAIDRLDPTRPVVIEAESSRIGGLSLPKQLWAAMCGAPRLRIAAPLAARAAYLTRSY